MRTRNETTSTTSVAIPPTHQLMQAGSFSNSSNYRDRNRWSDRSQHQRCGGSTARGGRAGRAVDSFTNGVYFHCCKKGHKAVDFWCKARTNGGKDGKTSSKKGKRGDTCRKRKSQGKPWETRQWQEQSQTPRKNTQKNRCVGPRKRFLARRSTWKIDDTWSGGGSWLEPSSNGAAKDKRNIHIKSFIKMTSLCALLYCINAMCHKIWKMIDWN